MGVLLRWVLGVIARLPISVVAWFGAILGWFVASVLRVRRREVESAMRATGIANPVACTRAMYRSLGISALELIALTTPHADALIGRVVVAEASRRQIARAQGLGRGLVVAATHTGNWDLAACAMAHEGELMVVTKHLKVRFLDRFWQETRAAHGVLLCDARGALSRARNTLKRGGAVAMMVDQVPFLRRHAIRTDFLGRPAWTDKAPATLAAAAAAPILLVASHRDEVQRQHLHVLGVWLPPERPTREWIERTTRDLSRSLGEFVRQHPSDWLWLHRRWKLLDSEPGKTMIEAPCETPSRLPGGPSTAA